MPLDPRAQEIGQRTEAQSETQRRLQEMTLLYQISTLIASAADVAQALHEVCAELARFLQVAQAGFASLDAACQRAEVIADYHPAPIPSAMGAIIPVANNPSMEYILEHKVPLVVDEAQADPRLAAVREIMVQRQVQSILLVPVIADGEVIGTLGFDAFEPRTFSDADVDLVQHVANQAGQLLMRRRAEENVQRLLDAERVARRQTEALREAAQVMGASLDVNGILRSILDQLRRVVVYDTASVLVLREGNLPDLIVGVGYEDEAETGQEAGRRLHHSPILEKMADNLQPVVSSDVWQLEGWVWVPGAEHVRSWMAIPLVVHGRLIGVLMADHGQPGCFGETELRLAQALARHAAQALENARLFEAEQQRARELSTLLEATRAVSSSLELDEVLSLIAGQMIRATQVGTCVLYWWDQEADALETWIEQRSDGAPSTGSCPISSSVESRQALDDSPTSRSVLETGQPRTICISDPQADPVDVATMKQGGTLSQLILPLTAGERIIGLVKLEERSERSFTSAEIRLVQALAAQAGVAIEHAQLFEDQMQARREIEQRQLYLEAVLYSAPDAIVTLDAQHHLVEWNPGAERLFGYRKEEAIGKSIDDLLTGGTPGSVEEAESLTQQVMSGRRLPATETVRFHRDGRPVDVQVAGSPIRIGDELIGLVGVYTGIGERKQAERALRKANRRLEMLSQCNEALFRARGESALLGEICQIAVDIGGYRMAWVGFAEQDEAKSVRPVAQAGFEEGYLDTVNITWADTERGRGPTGTAIRTGAPSIARDIVHEPRSAPWRAEATRRGFASSIALPLLTDEQPFGALNIYAGEPDAFDSEEVQLLTKLADNLAYGIMALRTRAERLRGEEAQRRYAERLVTLRQIDRAILEAQSPQAIAQASLTRIAGLVPCLQARITTFGSEPQQNTELAVHSADAALPEAGAAHLAAGGSRAWPARIDGPKGYQPEAGLREVSIPLLAQGEIVGTLQLVTRPPGVVDPEEIEIIYEVAAPLAVAIQQARLHEQLQRHANNLEETIAQRTRELLAERDRTQAILESLGEAVIVTDADGTILYSNPATLALTSYSSEELLGQDWRVLQEDSQSAAAYGQMQAAVQAGEAWRGEMVNQRKDGTLYDVAVTVAPLPNPDDDSQHVGSVWVQRDITPLKEAERFKDEFVSNVSHELRTPLSIVTLVVGNLDKLYERFDDEQRKEMIRSIREHVGLLNDLIGDVLEISRIDGGRISLERQPVDLAQMVREEADKQGPLARRRLQSLRVVGAESLVLSGNASQLRQVIRNLVNNAIKFTLVGGQITCECQVVEEGSRPGTEWTEGAGPWPTAYPTGQVGRWAVLRVEDTGVGIREEDIPHLSERFFRVQAQGSVPGTGLGLAIVRELVEVHGGQVVVASEVGKGSVFSVYLPLKMEEP